MRERDVEHERALQRERSARFRQRHPEQIKREGIREQWDPAYKERMRVARNARQRVHVAVLKGRLTKPASCERCGTVGYIEAAHADYSKVLDVVWLCRRCHRQWDAAQPKTKKVG
jgi:hypothetical protein